MTNNRSPSGGHSQKSRFSDVGDLPKTRTVGADQPAVPAPASRRVERETLAARIPPRRAVLGDIRGQAAHLAAVAAQDEEILGCVGSVARHLAAVGRQRAPARRRVAQRAQGAEPHTMGRIPDASRRRRVGTRYGTRRSTRGKASTQVPTVRESEDHIVDEASPAPVEGLEALLPGPLDVVVAPFQAGRAVTTSGDGVGRRPGSAPPR
jgi:hypothetical protein